jgi:hypothetical protein
MSVSVAWLLFAKKMKSQNERNLSDISGKPDSWFVPRRSAACLVAPSVLQNVGEPMEQIHFFSLRHLMLVLPFTAK